MSTFAIYNYQFSKIVKHAQKVNLFGDLPIEMNADEAFAKKQEIFGDLFDKDYSKKSKIIFTNNNGNKEFIHQYVIPPTDGIIIMKIANKKKAKIIDKNLKEQEIEDYPNSYVIFDNRDGIQRLLIENKKVAFGDVKQVERILQFTFDNLLRSKSLKIQLMHLQDSRTFWEYANDRFSHPKGFYRVRFFLPPLNLKRLQKTYDKLFTQARGSYDASMDWGFKANEGGELRLSEKDPIQKDMVSWIMDEVGGDNIQMFSNNDRRKAIVVGRNSYATISIQDKIIEKAKEDHVSNNLFGSKALDIIKQKTKTGI